MTTRTIGTLTGSRSAVAADRIPIKDVACSSAASWMPSGVKTDNSVVLFATWVDNYYSFGRTLHCAIQVAESFEADLFKKWGLSIKPSSRSVLAPESPDAQWDNDKWLYVMQADTLGHLVSADASPWPCWRKTEKSMWAAFWSNCVGPCARGLGVLHRSKMLDRSVRPVLHFRNTRWPFIKTIEDSQNRVQRQMLAHFVKVEPLEGEDFSSYHRRRMRLIGNLARQRGLWGKQHAERVVAWADHLDRPRNHASLAAELYKWHDSAWLQQRRIASGIMRPGTRAKAGYLPKRWDEAVPDARDYINAWSEEFFQCEFCCIDVVPAAIASCIAMHCQRPQPRWGHRFLAFK